MYFHPDITVKRKYADAKVVNRNNVEQNFMPTEKITVSPFRLLKTTSSITAEFCFG
jgi:hypothetical protein